MLAVVNFYNMPVMRKRKTVSGAVRFCTRLWLCGS